MNANDEQLAWNELEKILLSRIKKLQKAKKSGKSLDELTKEAIQAKK